MKSFEPNFKGLLSGSECSRFFQTLINLKYIVPVNQVFFKWDSKTHVEDFEADKIRDLFMNNSIETIRKYTRKPEKKVKKVVLDYSNMTYDEIVDSITVLNLEKERRDSLKAISQTRALICKTCGWTEENLNDELKKLL